VTKVSFSGSQSLGKAHLTMSAMAAVANLWPVVMLLMFVKLKLIAVCRLVGCQDLLDETPSKLSIRRDSSTLSPMDSKTLDRRTKTRSISKHDFKSDVGGISILVFVSDVRSFVVPQSAEVCCHVDKNTKTPVYNKVIHYSLSETAVSCCASSCLKYR